MLYAVIGASAGRSRDEVMAAFPRPEVVLDPFLACGDTKMASACRTRP